MSTLGKIVVGILVGMVVIVALGVGAFLLFFRTTVEGIGRGAEETRGQVPQVAAQIASFQLPAGFVEDYSVQGGGFAIAAYRGTDGHSHLLLAKGPSFLKLDNDELKRYVADQSGNSKKDDRVTETGSYDTQIDGQDVTVYFSEVTRRDGSSYFQASFAFQAKTGPATVVINRPGESWSEQEVKDFVASIKM